MSLASACVCLSGWAARSELAYAIATGGPGQRSALHDLPSDVVADVLAILSWSKPAPVAGDGLRLTALSFGVASA